jgi:hypothetical protein
MLTTSSETELTFFEGSKIGSRLSRLETKRRSSGQAVRRFSKARYPAGREGNAEANRSRSALPLFGGLLFLTLMPNCRDRGYCMGKLGIADGGAGSKWVL